MTGGDQPGTAPQYPAVVRLLAVAYVVAGMVRPLGFILFGGLAAGRYGMKQEADGWVLGAALAAGGCVVGCTAFRWWFCWWGARRYPEANGRDDGAGQ